MPVLPEAQRNRAPSLEADPLRYLRGVLGFFLGGAIVVALVLGLTGVAPRALVLAALLWTLLGLLTGMVDLVLEPLAEGLGGWFARMGRGPSPSDHVGETLRRAEQLSEVQGNAALAAAELELLQREAARLTPLEDLRIGLALAALYEQRLADPGRALGELRRLIDRYPELRQTAALRLRLAALRARHFGSSAA